MIITVPRCVPFRIRFETKDNGNNVFIFRKQWIRLCKWDGQGSMIEQMPESLNTVKSLV